MGEYVNIDGRSVKIGTCEDLTDITFQEFTSLLCSGRIKKEQGNDDPINYIKGGYRFRFPFPEEDGQKPFGAERRDLDKGLQITVPKSLGLSWTKHSELCHHVKPAGGGYGFNLFYPCPASPEWAEAKLKTSRGPNVWDSRDLIAIVQQRPLEGRLWTCIRCDYCQSCVRLDKPEADKLVAFIRGEHDQSGLGHQYWLDVASRIESGYAEDNDLAKVIALGWLPESECEVQP